MNHLSITVLLVATTAIATQGIEISLTNAKLGCRHEEPITLKQLKSDPNGACQQVEEIAEMGYGDGANVRLDLVNTCSCNILDKRFLFEWLLTDEVETLFESVKQILHELTEHSVYEIEVDEQNFLDLFEDNVSTKMKTAIVDHFYRHFSRYTTREAGIKILAEGCASLRANFGFVIDHFRNMETIVGDSRFLIKMTRYDENFFKLVTASKACNLFPTARYNRLRA